MLFLKVLTKRGVKLMANTQDLIADTSTLQYNDLEKLRKEKEAQLSAIEGRTRQRGYSKDTEDQQINRISGELTAIQELQSKVSKGEQYTGRSGISYIESYGQAKLERAEAQRKEKEAEPQLKVTNIKTPAKELPPIKARDYTKEYYQSKPQLLNFGYDRPEIKETGVLFTTEEEGKKLSQSGFSSYWVTESKDLQGAITEGQIAGATPQRTLSLGKETTGQFQYNRQQIIAQKDIFNQYSGLVADFKASPEKYKGQPGVTVESVGGGQKYSLTPAFFENKINTDTVYKNALISSKKEYSNLPKVTRRNLAVRGGVIGATQLTLGAGEFAGTIFLNLGSQQIQPGQSPLKTRQFTFGGSLGNIRTFPTTQSTVKFTESPTSYLSQKVKSPEVIGGGVVALPLAVFGAKSIISNVKTYGVKGGLLETASSLSPLRIEGGIYTPVVDSSTKLKVTSSKYTGKTGITTRYYTGQNAYGDVKISGIEQSKLVNGKVIGGGFKVTTTPYYEIRAGGAIVNTGVRQSIQPYSFASRGTGTAFGARGNALLTQQLTAKIPAGLADVRVAKGVDIFTETGTGTKTIYNYGSQGYKLTTGGSSKQVQEGVSRFFSGRAKPIYKTETYTTSSNIDDFKISERNFIYKPSGRFKVKPSTFGTEYDLNKFLGGSSQTGITTGGSGAGKTITKTIQTGAGVIGVNLPLASSKIKPSGNIIISTPTGRTQQVTRSIYKPVSTSIIKQTQETIQTPREIKAVRPSGAVINLQKNLQRTQQKPVLITSPTIKTSEITKQGQPQSTAVIQRVKILQRTGQRTQSGINSFPISPQTFNPYQPTTPIRIPIIPIKLGGFDTVNLGLGNVPSKSTGRSYVPSYSALFFNIRGRKPKASKSGLGFRPITPSFNIGKFLGFGNKRVIRVRRVL